MTEHQPLPMRPTAHERDGRQDLSVAAETARTAHDLHASGYDEATVSHALAVDELTIELLLQKPGGPR
ncbi:hypothetical protein ACFYXH_40475 [Streptomyces sp. NPDC002730]|uniref:hypothetical protein n=1 Tax=Streptomyces sp. NPDC002730 TaxID=3364662 RepID=UPI0036C46367